MTHNMATLSRGCKARRCNRNRKNPDFDIHSETFPWILMILIQETPNREYFAVTVDLVNILDRNCRLRTLEMSFRGIEGTSIEPALTSALTQPSLTGPYYKLKFSNCGRVFSSCDENFHMLQPSYLTNCWACRSQPVDISTVCRSSWWTFWFQDLRTFDFKNLFLLQASVLP